MKLYDITLTGNDGLQYSIRAYQTLEEMEHLQSVGIVDGIWEIVSIEPVSEIVMLAMGAFVKEQRE